MAIKNKMVDQQGKAKGDCTLSEKIFGVVVKDQAVADTVLWIRANQRQGTAKVKTRGQVKGGAAKPYRQKGTGNARQGTIRSPLFEGGGVVFGPTPRDYSYRLPKKVRRQALFSVLSQRQKDGKLVVVDDFKMKEAKTKAADAFLTKVGAENALVVDVKNETLEKSVRNLEKSAYAEAKNLNVYDVLKHQHLVLSSAAVKAIEEVYGK